MAYNIADLFEHTVDAVPDRICLVDGDLTLTYREVDERGNRIGHYLAAQGVGKDDHVGVYAQNSHQWLEAMLGCLKIRAVPINVNYRYVEDELAYLIGNAELVACIFDQEYAPRLAAVADRSPRLKTFVHIEDGSDVDASALGSVPFEAACAMSSPERDFGERSGDDLFVIYTGGTTGMPKGVMWRSEDIFFGLAQGIDALTGKRVRDEYQRAEQAAASPTPLVFCVIPPLMHGAGQIATLSQWFLGSTLVLIRQFSPEGVWDVFEAQGVNSMIITGDAMGRPLVDALVEHPDRWDLSQLVSISSSGAVFSQAVKDRFLEVFPNLIITDSVGSTESGFNGLTYAKKGQKSAAGGPTVSAGDDVVILDENLELVPDTDSRVGRLARGGNIPLGYYNDPVKTAETFVIAANGKRYVISGDSAVVGLTGPDDDARSRIGLHQLWRREDLPGGGRAGAQSPSGGVRLHRRGRARRKVGTAGRCGRGVPGRRVRDARRARHAHPRAHRRLQGAPGAPRRGDDPPGAVGQARLPLGQGARRVRERQGRGLKVVEKQSTTRRRDPDERRRIPLRWQTGAGGGWRNGHGCGHRRAGA